MSDTPKQTSFLCRAISMLSLGCAAGIPFMVVRDPLQAWMKESGVDLKTIGLLSLAGLPFALKFLWAPIFDRYIPLSIGRRRGWGLLIQLLLVAVICFLGGLDPREDLLLIAWIALFISFLAASQDIVLDAHRREYLPERELGLGSSLFVTGYRLGLLLSGAFALWLSTLYPWSVVYVALGVMLLIGTAALLLNDEPGGDIPPPKTLREAVVQPFMEFFSRKGAWEILLFVLLYKLGDILASTMTTPFFLEVGFSKSQIAGVAKTFGLGSAIAGGIIGGALIVKTGIMRALYLFGIVQALGILAFVWLSLSGTSTIALAVAVSAENLTSGMGTAAYTAYMASLCDKRFTATQYSLLSSLMAVPRVLFASSTGFMVTAIGWTAFFSLCSIIALPALLLLRREAFKVSTP